MVCTIKRSTAPLQTLIQQEDISLWTKNPSTGFVLCCVVLSLWVCVSIGTYNVFFPSFRNLSWWSGHLLWTDSGGISEATCTLYREVIYYWESDDTDEKGGVTFTPSGGVSTGFLKPQHESLTNFIVLKNYTVCCLRLYMLWSRTVFFTGLLSTAAMELAFAFPLHQ